MDDPRMHDHCESCYSRDCDFKIIQGISCDTVFCKNECGHKFHRCKQEDHNEGCRRQLVRCVNKQYGCPMTLERRQLGKHLEVCPANVLICTMEWNRWHHAALISKQNRKTQIQEMHIRNTVDRNLDIACAIHDQSILLETIMPSTVLQYYCDIADNCANRRYLKQTDETHLATKALSVEPGVREATSSIDSAQQGSKMKESDGSRTETTQNLLRYIDKIQKSAKDGSINVKLPEDTNRNHLNIKCGNSSRSHLDRGSGQMGFSEHGMNVFAPSGHKENRAQLLSTGLRCDFREKAACVQEFAAAAPGFMALLNALDSDICVVIDVVDTIVDEVVKMLDNPVIDWKEDGIASVSSRRASESKLGVLRRSISKLIQEISVVCDRTIGKSSSGSLCDTSSERKPERKKKSWLFGSNVTSGGYGSASWGWPRKQIKDVSTDTNDLPVDTSTIEWLSPEASVSQDDIIFRLFSIIGASSKGGLPILQKQVNHFMMDSSCQTVAPFLLHIDMNSIGRALCSASLSSTAINPDERHQMLSLLTNGKENTMDSGETLLKISDNLKYNNLALGSVVEFVPRYQTKPSSMYSFMCGCVVRRDQFSSHVENIHCEIMSGLNGWIEQKCPYAAYGCDYSEPRFCPDHHHNAVLYNQEESAFTISPGHWNHSNKHIEESANCHISLLDLPYEVHENIFRYLDCLAIRQISLTCSYFREVCKNHLASRGIVEMKWVKRCYANGSKSWKMEKMVWSFPPTLAKINRWVLSDSPAMAQHVSKCTVVAGRDAKYTEKRIEVLPNS